MELPEDKANLEKLYEETIEHHQTYLDKLHAAFDRRCDEIEKGTKAKIAAQPENEELKQALMQEQQQLLDKTLSELKYAINKSNTDAMKRLEEIEERIEGGDMDLDKELAEL